MPTTAIGGEHAAQMTTAPKDIKAIRGERVLQLTWPDGSITRLPFKFLRCECSCAVCVHEFTGERLLDPATVPEDISIEDMSLVGAYALRIRWTDGHDTGMFTWRVLSELRPPS